MGLTKAEKEQRAELEKKAREAREEERKQALAQLEVIKNEANALIEAERQKILPNFGTQLVSQPPDPTGLAEAISKEFKNLQVSIIYEDGHPSVRITPKQLYVNIGKYYHQGIPTVEQIMTDQVPYGAENLWPKFELVKSFVHGFECAARRVKNKEIDREIEDQYRHHPYFRMMRHYFG